MCGTSAKSDMHSMLRTCGTCLLASMEVGAGRRSRLRGDALVVGETSEKMILDENEVIGRPLLLP